ncbi:hypothetical protein [Xanthobacter sp. KR7-225]|uniref:hypothetical protein n=1 Tax=Xanthobacter sp. KR7-225 TaxID=3156613 RepID=UPI0032B564E8
MSTEQPSQGLSQRREAELKRAQAQQASQWGAIGISAVAAAAHQSSDKRAAEAEGAQKRIVTLRDIEYFAA